MDAPAPFTVFISGVSSEFRAARDLVASDLRARGLTVKVQRDFRQEANTDTTLAKLHHYIECCSAVVCIIGQRSGSCPPDSSAEPFAALLPRGFARASYTQWELLFARHHKRRLSIYVANENFLPSTEPSPAPGDDELQQAFVRHLVDHLGLDRSHFSTVHELGRRVLREDWPMLERSKPVWLPYPSLGPLFKGREEFLRQMRQALGQRGAGGKQAAAITASATAAAVHGLGGIGKTRAAVEYALAHQEEYTALLLVGADSPASLQQNLAALAGPAVLNLPQHQAPEMDVQLAAVLGWLQQNPGWLLILDNVDHEDAARAAEQLLGVLQGSDGQVLITSRLSSWSAAVLTLALDVLSRKDATAFLLERTDRDPGRRKADDDDHRARELAEELGCLALALEQAGAYIVRHRLDLAGYLTRWRRSRSTVLAWFNERVMQYPHSVAMTWQTSVDQLGDAARDLLGWLSWLAPEPVPEALLETLDEDGESHEDLLEVLAELEGYSLVTRDRDRPFFAVHRLVQQVTRRSLGTEQIRATLERALNRVDAAFIGDPIDVRDWPTLEPLAPHVLEVVKHADRAGIADPTSRLMNQLALLLLASNRLNQAEPLLRRALAIDEASLGPDHPSVATGLNNLAQLLQDTNHMDQAEPLLRRSLKIHEASLGHNHPTVATQLNNLATLLAATNRLDQAEPLLRRALEIDEAGLGQDHPSVAIDLNNLAQLLAHTNRLDQAEPLLRRALEIDEANQGQAHPTVARGLNNLAQLLAATNRMDQAEPLLRRALDIHEASLGQDHPSVATSLNNLALLLKDTDRLDEAEPLMRHALEIDEASLGQDHPEVARDLNNMGMLLQATNRLDQAEPLFGRCLFILHEFFRRTGHEHPNWRAGLANYEDVLRAMGRNEDEVQQALRSLLGEETGEGGPP